nr:MAG TPA: hypothetical protein [Caudoviricetes sp.]
MYSYAGPGDYEVKIWNMSMKQVLKNGGLLIEKVAVYLAMQISMWSFM